MLRKVLMPVVFVCCGFAATAEQVVIAALGDSLTQGYGLPEQDGFVPQLDRWLRAQGAEVRLINAGVSGDTTAGGAARVDWTLTPDVDAMIVALGGNDLLRGIDPAVSRTNLEAIVQTAEASGVDVLLIGMQAPGNYGAEYKAAFDAIYPELAAAYGTAYAPGFFTGLTAEGDPDAARRYMQSDGIHPNAEGVILIVESLGPYVLELVNATQK
ncbi:arylesterase [Ruegeria atlantica]|uniref:arylesterase n=1 Tax=Ruegeria atlantica TaxID=81569 RepID=UPI0014811226|nr:arylesterase [Ruegeria atlantica]